MVRDCQDKDFMTWFSSFAANSWCERWFGVGERVDVTAGRAAPTLPRAMLNA
jgi:hypothetical protein